MRLACIVKGAVREGRAMTTNLLSPRVGIDFAFEAHVPTPSELAAAGVTFVCRYLSQDAAKDLTAAEYAEYRSIPVDVVLVWETTADRMLGGNPAGIEDAHAADALRTSIGVPGIPPIYFACDFDATPGDQVAINDYLGAAASVIGLPRVGIYGGFWPVSRAFAAGKTTFGWQTFAWSGGQWEPRAQLRQVQNGVTVAGITVDIDHAVADNFGQVNFKPTLPPVSTSGTQRPWRHCDKCQGLYWGPGVASSKCPAGGTHQTISTEYAYILDWQLP